MAATIHRSPMKGEKTLRLVESATTYKSPLLSAIGGNIVFLSTELQIKRVLILHLNISVNFFPKFKSHIIHIWRSK
jgi:hypothetical protein